MSDGVSRRVEAVQEVRCSVPAEARRAVFLILDGLPERQRSALAGRVVAALRDAKLLASSVEQHFNATETARLVSRSPEYVVREFKAGRFGPVYRDDGGWLVPASGIESWLERRRFGADESADESSRMPLKSAAPDGLQQRESVFLKGARLNRRPEPLVLEPVAD
jgi:hypothetical protein